MAVLRHEYLDTLADHLAAEVDPGPARQLEAEPARLGERPVQGATEGHRLEDDEECPRSPGECRQPTDRLGALALRSPAPERAVAPTWQARSAQVDDEQVDGPRLEERSGHRQALVEMPGGEHDKPAQVHSPGDRLDRVERAARVEIGDDRSAGLRFGAEPQGERRLAARGVALEGRRQRTRQAARSKDRVEGGEAGRHDRSVARAIDRVDQAGPPPQGAVPPAQGEAGDSAIKGK